MSTKVSTQTGIMMNPTMTEHDGLFRPWRPCAENSTTSSRQQCATGALDLSTRAKASDIERSNSPGNAEQAIAHSYSAYPTPGVRAPTIYHQLQLQYVMQMRLWAMSRLQTTQPAMMTHSMLNGEPSVSRALEFSKQNLTFMPPGRALRCESEAVCGKDSVQAAGHFPLPTATDGEPLDLLPKSLYVNKSQGGHVCIFCGKVYSRKYGLKIHLRTHTGYKPLKCKVCSRPFGDPSNLNKHIRLHAEGETPYRCDFCGKVLVRRRDLERHIRSRHPDQEESVNLNTGYAAAVDLDTDGISVHAQSQKSDHFAREPIGP